MKTCVWVRSVEGRVLLGTMWRRKAVWTPHASYESEEVARSVAMGMMRSLPEWETKTVRVLPEGQRPANEVEFI
jgi:hypothetical protein